MSQRSLGKLDEFALKPINEVELTPEAIEHFRTNYRSEFGTSGADDPLYEAVSAGRHFPGMEHWLPLFGAELVPFDSYMPRAIVTLDHQVEEAVKRAPGDDRGFLPGPARPAGGGAGKRRAGLSAAAGRAGSISARMPGASSPGRA